MKNSYSHLIRWSSVLTLVFVALLACQASEKVSTASKPEKMTTKSASASTKSKAKKDSLVTKADTSKAKSAQPTQTANPPQAQKSLLPDLFVDENGKKVTIDFSIELKEVKSDGAILANFANRPLLVFYFSATCPHCQAAFPHIVTLSKELEAKGVSTIAIAVSQSSPSELKSFVQGTGSTIPMFQDNTREFGKRYGTGRVPVILLVRPDGYFRQLAGFDEKETVPVIRSAF